VNLPASHAVRHVFKMHESCHKNMNEPQHNHVTVDCSLQVCARARENKEKKETERVRERHENKEDRAREREHICE